MMRMLCDAPDLFLPARPNLGSKQRMVRDVGSRWQPQELAAARQALDEARRAAAAQPAATPSAEGRAAKPRDAAAMWETPDLDRVDDVSAKQCRAACLRCWRCKRRSPPSACATWSAA